MSLFKRGLLHTLRKKGKSLLMFLILLGIGTAILSSVAVKKASVAQEKQVNNSLNRYFMIKSNLTSGNLIGRRGFDNLPGSLIDEIKKVKEVSSYDAKAIGEAQLIDQEKIPFPEDNPYQFKEEDKPEYKKIIDINANSNTKLDKRFDSKVLQLKEGRHITGEDRQKIMVHETFAKKYNLKLHDTMRIKTSVMQNINENWHGSEELTLEVVGIFTGENQKMMTSIEDQVENLFFTDIDSVKKINHFTDETIPYQELKFYVKDGVDTHKLIPKIKKLPIDWSQYEVHEANYSFAGMETSMKSLNKLISQLLIGVVVISCLLLSFVLMFWMNGRTQETGILLSLGFSKFNILCQYVVELVYLSIPSFLLSYFTGNMIAQKIGDQLVTQAKEQGEAVVRQGGMMLGADSETGLLTKTIDQMNITIQGQEFISVFLLGFAIIVVSVALASFVVMRLKPKEILSKMS